MSHQKTLLKQFTTNVLLYTIVALTTYVVLCLCDCLMFYDLMKNDKNNGSGFFFSSEKREAFEAACKEGGQKICDVKGTIDNKSYFADTKVAVDKRGDSGCKTICREVSGMLSFPNSHSSKSGSNSVGGAVD